MFGSLSTTFLFAKSITSYYYLFGILKIDNIFILKVIKLIEKIIIVINYHKYSSWHTIKIASSQQSCNTKFSAKNNFIRSKPWTNYGTHFLCLRIFVKRLIHKRIYKVCDILISRSVLFLLSNNYMFSN